MPLRIGVVATAGHGGGRFRAVLQPGPRRKYEEFLRYCEETSTVHRGDVAAIMSCLEAWIVNCAADGKECDLGPIGRTRLAARGSFDSIPKTLKDSDLQLNMYWILPARIKNQVREIGETIARQLVVPKGRRPSILGVRAYDTSARTWRRDRYLAGGLLELRGVNLKFDAERPDAGVFLRTPAAKNWTRVEACLDVLPKRVRCLVPESFAGKGPLRLQIDLGKQAGVRTSQRDEYAKNLGEIAG